MAQSKFRLRPSQAAVWSVCPGSVGMQERYPEEEGQEAKEGTAAHWVWLHAFHEQAFPAAGSLAPNGVVITDEMLSGAETYMSCVREPGLPLYVEQVVHEGAIHPQCGGTPDTYAIDFTLKIIYLWDYKYGHKYVSAYRNKQLLLYVAEIIDKVCDGFDLDWTVKFCVVQPRSYQNEGMVKPWDVNAAQLRNEFIALRDAAVAAAFDKARCVPGPHCEHCSGRHACVTLQSASYGVISVIGEATAFDLDPTALGVELKRLEDAAKMLDARVTGLQAQATAAIKAGKKVPHFAVEPTTARLQWNEGVGKEVMALGELYGVQLVKEREPITPTQALAKGIDPEVIKLYADRPTGSLKLVRSDTSQTSKIFGV